MKPNSGLSAYENEYKNADEDENEYENADEDENEYENADEDENEYENADEDENEYKNADEDEIEYRTLLDDENDPPPNINASLPVEYVYIPDVAYERRKLRAAGKADDPNLGVVRLDESSPRNVWQEVRLPYSTELVSPVKDMLSIYRTLPSYM